MKYKGYLINPSKTGPSLYSVAVEGKGGKIPNCLSGYYTTRTFAISDIDRYLDTKEKSNAKEPLQSGG